MIRSPAGLSRSELIDFSLMRNPDDVPTIQALSKATQIARQRGALAAAAELVEMAINRFGDELIRRMQAAERPPTASRAPPEPSPPPEG